MSIDEMPAGRELDALVAERVMGWRTAHFDMNAADYIGVPLDDYWETVPRYSTDIAAAWLVVDALGERHKTYVARLYQLLPHCWVCNLLTDSRHEYRGIGYPAPLAICRAALKAVGGAS